MKMGPIVSEGQFNKVLGYIREAKKAGARLLCGGNEKLPNNLNNGWFIQPTVFENVTDTMNIWKEEVFGLNKCVFCFFSFPNARFIVANKTNKMPPKDPFCAFANSKLKKRQLQLPITLLTDWVPLFSPRIRKD